MRRGKRGGWYSPALIVGTALATFFLGSAVTMWLATAPPPAVVQGTAAALGQAGPLAEKLTRGQITGGAGSPANQAQAPAAQKTASGSAQPAETAARSAAPPPSALAASAAPPTASPASVPGPASPAPRAGDFSLQLGAFLDAAKAKSLTDQLATRGYSPASIDAADGSGRTWHYVRLGAFADERAAALAAADLVERTGIGAAVVRLSAANAGH